MGGLAFVVSEAFNQNGLGRIRHLADDELERMHAVTLLGNSLFPQVCAGCVYVDDIHLDMAVPMRCIAIVKVGHGSW